MRALVAGTAVVVVLAAGGCYSRVVGEKGVGTGVNEVYQPNLDTDGPINTGGFKWSRADPDPSVQEWKSISNSGKSKP